MNAFDALKQPQPGAPPMPTAPPAAAGLPVPPDLDALFAASADEFGVPVGDVRAIAKQESNFDPKAVSKKGAQGVMQLMPKTAAAHGVTDPFDPTQNIRAGTEEYAQHLKHTGGDRSKALAMYNFGHGNVEKGLPYPPETQDYIKRVEGYAGPAAPPPPPKQKSVQVASQNAIQALSGQSKPAEALSFFSHPERAIEGAQNIGQKGIDFVREHPEEAARLGVETLGAGVGSMLIPGLGAARAPFLAKRMMDIARMGGAGAGAGAGSLASEKFDPSGTPKAAIEKAERAAGGAAAGEGLGRAFEFLTGPLRGTLVPGAREMKETLEQNRLPSETRTFPAYIYRDAPMMDSLEGSVEKALGGGRIKLGREQAEGIAQRSVKEFPLRFGQTEESVMRNSRMQKQLATDLEQFRQRANQMYARVDALNQQNPIFVDMQPVHLLAMQRWFEADMGRLNPATTKLVNDMLRRGKPDGQGGLLIPFQEAHRLRSDLRKAADPDAIVQGQTESLAESLAGLIDQQMDTAGQALNPQALAAYRQANLMYKGTPQQPGMQQFDSPLMERLMSGSPDEFSASLFRKDRPVRIDTVQKLSPTMSDDMRRAYAEHLGMKMGAVPNGQQLQEMLFQEGATLEAVLGKAHANDLRHLADVLVRTQKEPGGTVRFGQGSLLVGMAYSSVNPAKGATILVLPSALSYAMHNRVIAHWLSLGADLKPGSREAIRWTGRLIGLLKQNNIPFAEVPAEWADAMLGPQQPPASPPLPVPPAPPATGTTPSGPQARRSPAPTP